MLINLFLFFISLSVFADESTLVKSLGHFKDGVVFEHEPTHFKSKFRFRVQNRFTYQTEESEKLKAKQADFSVRRMRLRYEGNAFDPRLLFKFQLAFTRVDMNYDQTSYPNILRDAVVGWKLSDKTTFWYGQMKLPGNRQLITSSGSQQFVDRSVLNATFNIDRDIGPQVHHQIGTDRPVWIKAAISNGEGRASENKDNGLSYTGRIEWLPLGVFKDEGDYFEGDLSRELTPKLSIAGAYSLNKNATRSGAQLGKPFTTPGLSKDIETWFADLILKYQGFAFTSEYMRRTSSDVFFQDGVNNVTIYNGDGINAQFSYVTENNIEPALRLTRIWADKETLNGENNRTQYTAGLSKYINQHRIKVQTDLSFDEQTNNLKNLYQSSWIFRAQLEVGI